MSRTRRRSVMRSSARRVVCLGLLVLLTSPVTRAQPPDPRTPGKLPDVTKARPEPLLMLRHVWEANSVVWSPDGKRLAAGSGHRGIGVWDATTGNLVWKTEGDGVGDFVLFSPDRKLLVAARNWKQGKAGGVIQF